MMIFGDQLNFLLELDVINHITDLIPVIQFDQLTTSAEAEVVPAHPGKMQWLFLVTC
jgi:hypothetical protein